MMAIAEAPAKVILTGEHFVVHGAWALAAAVSRRSHVEVSKADRLHIHSTRFPGPRRAPLLPAYKVVEAMAREHSFPTGLSVSISSEIPEGAGLGSSASTLVSVAAAVAKLQGIRLTPDEAARWSMIGEKEVHGKPSGIDPAICSRGGVLLFRPGEKPRPVRLDSPRSLLVAYTGVTRSTKRQISRVSAVREMFPALFAGLTESAGEISLLAAQKLREGDIKSLGRLLSFNHAVLSTMGVSNASLDRLVDLFLSLGSYGAKLTGAGGGGSAVAVAPKGKEKSIISGLTARGFDAFKTEIPVRGVQSWLRR
ncbi:MAG: mevalonate kinase [archaeon]|nr:MAG: mevalonate kinase [archaeon]